jgi:hypothetical protein
MADYTFWVPLGGTLLSIIAGGTGAYYQWKGVQLQQLAQPPAKGKAKAIKEREKVLLPKWYRLWLPHVVMLVLVIALWVPWLARPNAVERPPIIHAWGAPNVMTCSMQIDASVLVKKFGKDNVAIICGISDATIDKWEDTRITVSNPYSIRPEILSIVTPTSASMLGGLQRMGITVPTPGGCSFSQSSPSRGSYLV